MCPILNLILLVRVELSLYMAAHKLFVSLLILGHPFGSLLSRHCQNCIQHLGLPLQYATVLFPGHGLLSILDGSCKALAQRSIMSHNKYSCLLQRFSNYSIPVLTQT